MKPILWMMVWATTAWADLRLEPSLAWSMTQAQTVVDGIIVERVRLDDRTERLTLAPQTTLSGPAQDRVDATVPHGTVSAAIGERVILFADAQGSAVRIIRQGEAAYQRSGMKLDDIDDIQRHIAQLNETPTDRQLTIGVPSDGLSPLSLIVPANAETEALLLARLQSDDMTTRAMGAAHLRHFPTDRNAQRLRALLDDRETFPRSSTHVVCEHARQSLIAMNQDVPDDVCEP
ncbi:MAG: hypothetical protein AAFV53_20370 [Myxococcota bacterium]